MTDPTLMLSCDWGTTSLRLRLISGGAPTPQVVAEFRSGAGVASVAAASDAANREARYRHTLRGAIGVLAKSAGVALDGLPIVISGMASSSIGWQSLPYARLPFDLSGKDAISARLSLDKHPILLISGVRSERDVMRGEETELIGLSQLPEAQPALGHCIAILPGTHSKHVEILAGKVVAFRTLMSGEMYSVVSRFSVLRHSISVDDEPITLPSEPDQAMRSAFVEGVTESLQSDLLAALFQTRTRQLLQNVPPALNAAFLSGAIIGNEIGSLRRLATSTQILLCAGKAVSAWYALALSSAGLHDRTIIIRPEQVDQLSMLGHIRIRH